MVPLVTPQPPSPLVAARGGMLWALGFLGLLLQASFALVDQTDESRLLAYLSSRTNAHGIHNRPLLNSSTGITVTFGMRLIQVDVTESKNIMTIGAWVRQSWVDEIQTWDPAAFGGLDLVVVPLDKLWVPLISLVNTADTQDMERSAEALIHADGTIFYISHRKFESACLIDLTSYPFDTQRCDLWFQSLTYTSTQLSLDVYPPGFDLETQLPAFRESDEWEVMVNTSEVVRFPGDSGAALVFSRRKSLRFSLTIKRRAGFTAYLLTVPCVVLSATTLMVFVMPHERPDRHVIATTMFSNFFLLLLILISSAPPSAASVPKLGVYYAVNISLVLLSLVLSSIVVNLHRQGVHGVPFPKCLAWLVARGCCSCSNCTLQTKPINSEGCPETQMSETAVMSSAECVEALHKQHWSRLANTLDRVFFFLQLMLILVTAVLLFPTPDETFSHGNGN